MMELHRPFVVFPEKTLGVSLSELGHIDLPNFRVGKLGHCVHEKHLMVEQLALEEHLTDAVNGLRQAQIQARET